jgi:hypothetical protein
MGWETRRGKLVYYRKERYRDAEGRSRVRSVYCGSGERGKRAAREDELRRECYLPPVMAAPPEPLAPRAFGPVEPPRPSPAPVPAPAPLLIYPPRPAAAPRLRGVAAWRAMGRLTRR